MDSHKHQKHGNFIRSLTATMDSCGEKWFICFGTLLTFVRDHKFDLEEQDIDIGFITENASRIIQDLSTQYKVREKVEDRKTGEPLKVTFKIPDIKAELDVFFWKKVGSIYYHAIDNEITFKGIPAMVFECPPKDVEAYKQSVKFRDAFRMDGTWRHWVPGYEADSIYTVLPYQYGHALDEFYPGWYLKNKAFGMSHTQYERVAKSWQKL